jgi:hypothetical protein
MAMVVSRPRGERQVGQQVLRLQAQQAVAVGGGAQVDGCVGEVGAHVGRRCEIEPEEADDAAPPRLVDLAPW